MDAVSLERLESLHPKYKEIFKNFYKEVADTCAPNNGFVRVSQGFRSFEEQNQLYKIGREIKGSIVTNAKGGQSMHNYGLAIDIIGIINNKQLVNLDWKKVIEIAKKYNLECGAYIRGYPKGDYGHYEPKGVPRPSQLINMPKDKDGWVIL